MGEDWTFAAPGNGFVHTNTCAGKQKVVAYFSKPPPRAPGAEPIPQSKPKPGARRERVSFLYSCSDCAELNDHLPQVFLFKGKPKLKCGAWKTPHGLTPEEAPANYPKNRNKRGGFGTGATKIGECFQKNAPFWRRKLPRLFRSFFHFYSGFSRTTP